MSGAVARFAAGFLVGAAIGFFAANAFDRTRRAPSGAPPAAATSPAAAPSDDDLTDDELRRAMAAVDARPNDYEAQFKLGEFLLRIGSRPADAIRYYERASELKPTEPDALVGLGDANFATALATADEGAYDAKRLDAAASAYERALKLAPKNAAVHAALGMTCTLRRPADLDRATREFRAALAADATNELALEGLATALAAKGDVAGAQAAVARLEAVNPRSPGLARARAAVEEARKK
jgi:cytochrome c-type biogenesis protein CcmH/NrfG